MRPGPDWLAAILGANAERCVWGSDWPHMAPHGQQTGDGVTLPRELADAILRHNPARLYGFR